MTYRYNKPLGSGSNINTSSSSSSYGSYGGGGNRVSFADQQQQQQQQSYNSNNNTQPTKRDEHYERLHRFYEKVNPSKLQQIDEILAQFKGQEEEMFDALEKKYNVSTQLGGRLERQPQQQQQQQQQQPQRDAFGNTISMLDENQVAAQEQSSRTPASFLPEQASMQVFSTQVLPQMHKSLHQIQEAYGKLTEAIAVANTKGNDVAKSAPWIVSAQLGCSSFLANAKQFVTLAGDEERRMKDVHHNLQQAANVISSGKSGGNGSGVFRASASSDFSQQNQDTTSRDISTPLGASLKKSTHNNRVVFDVSPLGGEKHVVSDLIRNHAHAGDLIILHPGIYYENLVLRYDIEIRVASTAAGGVLANSTTSASSSDGTRSSKNTIEQTARLTSNDALQEVLFIPADASMATLQVVGDSKATLNGIHFVKGDRHGNPITDDSKVFLTNGPAHQDGVPHVSLTGRGKMRIENCTFTGAGGGVVCVGNSELQASMCLFRGCAFAAVYAKDASFVELIDVRCQDCEVGVRIRDANFSCLRSEIVRSVADGVVLHGNAKAEMERAVISDCAASGMQLSSAASLVLTDCRVLACAKWGIDAPHGADFAVVRGMIVKNVLGQMSRQPTRL